MKKYLLLFVSIIIFTNLSKAQLGFTVSPTQGLSEEWQVLVENYVTGRQTDLFKYASTATLDYTFPLNAKEWEFAPALHAMRTHNIFHEHDFEVNMVGLQTNFNFTPFKLYQDRELERSRFYFQLSPGVDFVRMQYLLIDDELNKPIKKLTDRELAINGGLNFLIDIELTHLLKISPVAGIRYYPNLSWTGFTKTISNEAFINEYDQINWRHLTLGLRIGFNLESMNRKSETENQ